MMEILKPILITVLTTVASGVASVITAYVVSFIKSKIKDKNIARMLCDINTIVMDSVKCVYQSFVQTLKDNDKFDEKAQAEAKSRAITIIKDKLSSELVNYITNTFGDLTSYLSTQIESALYTLKN